MDNHHRTSVRFSRAEERKPIEAISKLYKETKDFSFCWFRWGNWERHPPLVAVEGRRIVGYHAAAFSSRIGYVTSYYQGVLPEYQGRGLGGLLLDSVLAEAAVRELTRFKFKTPKYAEAAIAFWKGFGLAPFGEDSQHYLWDFDIEQIGSVKSLIEWGPGPGEIPPRQRRFYEKQGVDFYA